MSEIAGAFILGIVAGIIGGSWLTWREVKKARARTATVRRQRDFWRDKYQSEVTKLLVKINGADDITYHWLAWEREMEAER